MSPLRTFRFFVFLIFSGLLAAPFLVAQTPANRQYLHGTWRMQSSCTDSAKGEQLSLPGYDTSKWHPAEVPGRLWVHWSRTRPCPTPITG